MSPTFLERDLEIQDETVATWLNHPEMDGRPLNRWTPSQFLQMCELGIFDEAEVELIQGVIVHKMTRNSLHDVAIHLVADELLGLLPRGWVIRYQAAVIAGRSSLEPDLAVVRGPHTMYLNRHPVAADAGLIVEIADSSVARDRLKASEYCRAGVDEYWIVNLAQRQLEVFSDPDEVTGQFQQQLVLKGTDTRELHLKGELCGRFTCQRLLPPERLSSS